MVSTLQHLVTVIKIVTLLSLVTIAPLFAVTAATPTGNETWVDTFTAALADKFGGILTIPELADSFLYKDGTNQMTGNLNMGNQSITNVNQVDGVDVSQLKSDFDTIAAFFEVGDADNAINKMQEIIDVFQGYEEGFDLANELLTKMDVDGSNSALTGLTFDDEVTQATLTYDHDQESITSIKWCYTYYQW
jgi:hypothetical protein